MPTKNKHNIKSNRTITLREEFSKLNGIEVSADSILRNKCEYRKCDEESLKVATILKAGGYNVFTNKNIAIVNPLTGEATYLANYRNQSIVPIISFKKTQNSKKLFTAFLQDEANKEFFTIVLRGGWVKVEEYRHSHQQFVKQINTLNKWMGRNGFEMLLYCIERTPHANDGDSHLNLHAHITYRVLSVSDDYKLTQYITKRFDWMPAPQKVQADEYARMSNYMHKADKTLCNDFDLVTLAYQQHNLHFRQPKNSFRDFINEVNRKRLRATEDAEGNIYLVKKYTRPKQDIPPNKALPNRINQVIRASRPMQIGSDNRLITGLIVRNYDGNYRELLKKPHVQALVARIKKQFTINTFDEAQSKYKAISTVSWTKNNNPFSNTATSSTQIPF